MMSDTQDRAREAAANLEGAMPERELMTTAEVAKQLKVHPITVIRMLRSGKLPGFQVTDRAFRVDRVELQRWIESQRVNTEQEVAGLTEENRALVEARAREVIRSWWDDDIGEDERGEWLGRAMVSLLDHHGIRIVDAAQDDRRTEAIRAFEEFVHVIDGGASMGIDHGLSAGFARRKLDPYLHDDDTGNDGETGREE